jgi:hypothetical protein
MSSLARNHPRSTRTMEATTVPTWTVCRGTAGKAKGTTAASHPLTDVRRCSCCRPFARSDRSRSHRIELSGAGWLFVYLVEGRKRNWSRVSRGSKRGVTGEAPTLLS